MTAYKIRAHRDGRDYYFTMLSPYGAEEVIQSVMDRLLTKDVEIL